MIKGIKSMFIVFVVIVLFRALYPIILNSYFTPEREIPSVTEVTYSKQQDFILVGCELYSYDGIDRVEIHFNDEVVLMQYNTTETDRERYPRYVAQIPLVDDEVEVKIISYDIDGDSSTYIIEK